MFHILIPTNNFRTYPERFNGAWCSGYHDDTKALFPANTVQLIPPQAEAVHMSPKSTLTTFAKWDHKHKDSNPSGWLSFKANEKITNIGFPYQDYWAWSGCNSKGKYGIFPRCFVSEIVDLKPGFAASIANSPVDQFPGHSRVGSWSATSPLAVIPQHGTSHKKTFSRGSAESEKDAISSGASMAALSPTVASGSHSTGGWSLGRVVSKPFGRRNTNGSRSSDGSGRS